MSFHLKSLASPEFVSCCIMCHVTSRERLAQQAAVSDNASLIATLSSLNIIINLPDKLYCNDIYQLLVQSLHTNRTAILLDCRVGTFNGRRRTIDFVGISMQDRRSRFRLGNRWQIDSKMRPSAIRVLYQRAIRYTPELHRKTQLWLLYKKKTSNIAIVYRC